MNKKITYLFFVFFILLFLPILSACNSSKSQSPVNVDDLEFSFNIVENNILGHTLDGSFYNNTNSTISTLGIDLVFENSSETSVILCLDEVAPGTTGTFSSAYSIPTANINEVYLKRCSFYSTDKDSDEKQFVEYNWGTKEYRTDSKNFKVEGESAELVGQWICNYSNGGSVEMVFQDNGLYYSTVYNSDGSFSRFHGVFYAQDNSLSMDELSSGEISTSIIDYEFVNNQLVLDPTLILSRTHLDNFDPDLYYK